MHTRLPKFAVTPFVTALCVLMLISASLSSVYAAPDEVGWYPNPEQACQNVVPKAEIAGLGLAAAGAGATFVSVSPNPVGGSIALMGVSASAVALLAGGLCEKLDDGVRAIFVQAYEDAWDNGISLGTPDKDVHYWVGGVMIQDFPETRDREGNMIGDGWSAILANGPDGSDAYAVAGSTWAAYKHAIYEPSVLGGGIFPGYPTSPPYQWNRVTIQDFSGSSWGISAIIGGDQEFAWLVTGNHLQAYIDADGSNTLGNPLGPVEFNADGGYQQVFEGGTVNELSGQIDVKYNDSAETPSELPSWDYEGEATQSESQEAVIQTENPESVPQAPSAPSGEAPAAPSSCDNNLPVLWSFGALGNGDYHTDEPVPISAEMGYSGCVALGLDVQLVDDAPDGSRHILYSDSFEMRPGWVVAIGIGADINQVGNHQITVEFNDGSGWQVLTDQSGAGGHLSIFVNNPVPKEPGTPGGPETPVEPEAPEEPEAPREPETPVEPETPWEP